MRQLSLLLLLIPSFLSAAICVPYWIPQYAPEVRISYFRPNSSDSRSVYTNRATAFDYDLNVRLKNRIWLWESIGHFTKSGKNKDVRIGAHPEKEGKFKYQKSHIAMTPVTAGFKLYHCLCPYVDAFIGAGARWNFVRFRNLETKGFPHHKRIVRKRSLGIAVIGGLRMLLDHCIYISPFAEYSHNEVHFRKSTNNTARRIVQIGGVKIGAGIGVVI